MAGIRIIAGSLRGRVIPFSNKDFDNADITPQKVKGAIFSMMGEWLYGKGFLDLFAGSGQIGIEALSRGAHPVIMNEADTNRYRFINSYLAKLNLEQFPVVLNFTAEDAIRHAGNNKWKFDYIFLDPPYQKNKDHVASYRDIIQLFYRHDILADGGKIIIQHYSQNIMDEAILPYHLILTKIYGKTSLSLYSC